MRFVIEIMTFNIYKFPQIMAIINIVVSLRIAGMLS